MHELRLGVPQCDAILSGKRLFEIRYNDKGFQAGDKVRYIPVEGKMVASHEIEDKTFEITYVTSGVGLKEGYVVFGIKPLD